jgi:hypothetical protein
MSGEDVYELSYRVGAANSNASGVRDDGQRRHAETWRARSVQREKLLTNNVRIADMEWALWIFLIVMLGLYFWSHVTAGRKIGKELQPFVDELFGVTPSAEPERKGDPPVKPGAE